MKPSQVTLAIILLTGIGLLLFLPLLVLLAIGNSFLTTLWIIFMILFIILLLHYTILFMKAGKMVLLSSFGNIYNLFSPQIPDKNGTFDSGILITTPFLTQRQILPTGIFLVSLESNTANTADEVEDPTAAVRVYAHIQVQLEQDVKTLSTLIHALPGAGTHANFTKNVYEKRYITEGDGLLPGIIEEPCPCLATFLRTLLQTPFNEAVGQAVGTFSLKKALLNAPTIQTMILDRLKKPDTAFGKRELEKCFSVFDINLVAIVATNQATVDAIASHGIAVRTGQATVAKATADGEAKIITETARAKGIKKVADELATEGARIVVAADALKTVGTLNVVTGTDALTAAANLIITKEGGNKPPAPPPQDKNADRKA